MPSILCMLPRDANHCSTWGNCRPAPCCLLAPAVLYWASLRAHTAQFHAVGEMIVSNESRLGKSTVQMNFMVSQRACASTFTWLLCVPAQAVLHLWALATTAAHLRSRSGPQQHVHIHVQHEAMSLSKFTLVSQSNPASTQVSGARVMSSHVNYTKISLLPLLCGPF